MTRILVVDTETTGLEPPPNSGVVEYAHAVVDESATWPKKHKSYLCNPGIPIDVVAQSVHHISQEMIEDKPPLADQLAYWEFDRIDYYCAHNVEFDRQFLAGVLPDRPWICTYRCALHLWPDAPRHSNQVLRYWLGLKPYFTDECGATPHRALYDVCVTVALLQKMLTVKTAEELAALTTQPVVLGTCRFGKHAGTAWRDVPRSYMNWILGQGDFDRDVVHTCRYHLGLVT